MAQHKSSSPHRKTKMAESWARGEKRKEMRREMQNLQASENRVLRKDGKPTAWDLAKAARLARRIAAGKTAPA